MKHFSLKELCDSTQARKLNICNRPTQEIKNNLETLVREVLDPVRAIMGVPIIVTSGYRCKRLNDAVNGAVSSSHILGEAADITCSDNEKLFELIRDNFVFDQLIDEKNLSWIHVSYRIGNNRNQILKIE